MIGGCVVINKYEYLLSNLFYNVTFLYNWILSKAGNLLGIRFSFFLCHILRISILRWSQTGVLELFFLQKIVFILLPS